MRFFIIIFLFISSFSFSAENIELSKAPVDLKDNQSLQRGARTFVNYCLNCHSAKYMRYSNLQDIGLSAETIKFTSQNLINLKEKKWDIMWSVSYSYCFS